MTGSAVSARFTTAPVLRRFASAAVTAVLELPGVRLERAEPATGLVFRKPDAVVATWEPATSAPAR